MTTFSEFVREDRRLVILRVLDESPGYQANESVIEMALERFGHRVARDIVRDDLQWLHEHGLVENETVGDRVWVATATKRGMDVAQGRAMVPGVKRPSPRG
jgi:repressor of nif and glnA expression